MKYNFHPLFLIMFLFSVSPVFAQQIAGNGLPKQEFPKKATVRVSEIKDDFMPLMRNMEMPVPGHETYRQFLMLKKQEMQQKTQKSSSGNTEARANTAAELPILEKNFEGNAYHGIPNDNDMAISNDGKVVSVVNSTILFYDVNLDSILSTISLHAFSATLNIPQGKYDPKVVYDPKQDKFIMIFLNGNIDINSFIILAFSETNDPMGDWHLYALPGDPFSQQLWSDYPIVALTDDELFITVNLLQNAMSWQLGFVESIIWQIDKFTGFSGQNLDSRVINDVRFDGKPLRNICPIQGGITTSGPDLYLLSNRNFDTVNDTVFLMKLTGKLDNPNPVLEVQALKTDVPYGLAPEGKQLGSNNVLQTNDSRVLGGFYEAGQIQYVQNSIFEGTGHSAVYHGIIRNLDSAPEVTGKIITVDTLYFGYPNIASTAKYIGDNEAVITFLFTGDSTYPGSAAVFYDGYNKYSEPLVIKEGVSWVNVLSGLNERWGDYSGSQRKYNEPGKVWMSGSFGIAIQDIWWTNTTGTWIAELSSPDTSTSPPASVKPVTARDTKASAFPNPATEFFTLEFNVEEPKIVEVNLYDAQGRLVKLLLHDKARKGQNRFTFSTNPLSAGVYLLKITSKGEDIAVQRVVVSR